MNIHSIHRNVRASELPVEKLAGNSSLSEKEKLGEAARHFESLLLRQILNDAQKPHFQSKYSSNSTSAGIYRDMVTNQLADDISRSGAFGLARVLAAQMSPRASRDAAEDLKHSSLNPDAPAPRLRHVPSKGAYRPRGVTEE